MALGGGCSKNVDAACRVSIVRVSPWLARSNTTTQLNKSICLFGGGDHSIDGSTRGGWLDVLEFDDALFVRMHIHRTNNERQRHNFIICPTLFWSCLVCSSFVRLDGLALHAFWVRVSGMRCAF